MVKKTLKADSIVLKLVFIFAIVIVLIVANLFTGSKLSDREYEYNHAKSSIINGAGGNFVIEDVFLVIPYSYQEKRRNSKDQIYYETVWANEYIRPSSVKSSADLKTQERNIGIYSFPIYSGDVSYEATFDFSATLPVRSMHRTIQEGVFPKDGLRRVR